ncbi:MAG TPA: phosphatase PAP2 family protein [Burkholderiales bacterium]|nr:phosphatase PAP2 family protein [Burkholderiales bacterium]
MFRLDLALSRIQRWDERVCLRFNRALRYRVLLGTFRAVSRLGDGVFWYALMLGLLLSPAHAAPAVAHMALVGLACSVLYKLLKRGASRPRPYQVHSAIAVGASPLDRFSFPSGHTLHAVAFTLVALVHYPALATLLVPFTLLVALSRVVLGLHYPSDVLAGALIGAALAGGSFLL